MRLFCVLLALSVAAVRGVPSNPQRIVGGWLTTVEQIPEIVSLLYSWTGSGYVQSCAGSILNTRSILSAAHCVVDDPAYRWRVRAGSSYANSGGSIYSLSNIIGHSSYNSPIRYDNDVAILRLSSTITFSTLIKPASIAGANYNLGDNQVVWAVGWGKTAVGGSLSEQLRHVQIWTVNQTACKNRYALLGYTVTDNMLCSGWLDVGGRDQCQSDSGGPLYHNGVVVGICSWGQQCALAQYPGINTRVSRFTPWIQANA